MTDVLKLAEPFLNQCVSSDAPCRQAADECDPFYACDSYKQRQKAYRDALGLVIGEKP